MTGWYFPPVRAAFPLHAAVGDTLVATDRTWRIVSVSAVDFADQAAMEAWIAEDPSDPPVPIPVAIDPEDERVADFFAEPTE